MGSSLCNLCVLCVSVVIVPRDATTTENTEEALPTYQADIISELLVRFNDSV
jgi:hypothetical protein